MNMNVADQLVAKPEENMSRKRIRFVVASLIAMGALVVVIAYSGSGMRTPREESRLNVNVETKPDVNYCLTNPQVAGSTPFSAGTPPNGQYITSLKVFGGPGWVTGIEVWYDYKATTTSPDFTYGGTAGNLWTDSFSCASGEFINKVEYNMAYYIAANQYGQLIHLVPWCSNGAKAPVTNTGGQIGSSFMGHSTSCSTDLPGPLTGFSGAHAMISATFAFRQIKFEAYSQSTCTYSKIQTFPVPSINVRGPFGQTSQTIKANGCPMYLLDYTPNKHMHTFNPTTCSVTATEITTEFDTITTLFFRLKVVVTASGANAFVQSSGVGAYHSDNNYVAAPSNYFYPVEAQQAGAQLLPDLSVLKTRLQDHEVPKQMVLLSNNGDEYALDKLGGISLVYGTHATTYIAFYKQVGTTKYVVGLTMSWSTSAVVAAHVDKYEGVTKQSGSLVGSANQVIDLANRLPGITSSYAFEVNRNKVKLVW